MNMHVLLRISLACILALGPLHAHAGGKKAVAKTVAAKLLARDAARDAASVGKAKAVTKTATVWRYTTVTQARRELQSGIRPGSHFTPGVTRGRLPKPVTAQRQYGLPRPPDVRMAIRLDKGRVVLRNKALGGEPGRGEVVPMRLVPPDAIQKVMKLPKPSGK